MYLYYTNNKYIMYYMYHVYIIDFIKIENFEKGNKNKATSSESRQRYFDQFFSVFTAASLIQFMVQDSVHNLCFSLSKSSCVLILSPAISLPVSWFQLFNLSISDLIDICPTLFFLVPHQDLGNRQQYQQIIINQLFLFYHFFAEKT